MAEGEQLIREQIQRVQTERLDLRQTEYDAAAQIQTRAEQLAGGETRKNGVDVALATIYGSKIFDEYFRVEPIWANFVDSLPRRRNAPVIITETISYSESYDDGDRYVNRRVAGLSMALAVVRAKRPIQTERRDNGGYLVVLGTIGRVASYTLSRPEHFQEFRSGNLQQSDSLRVAYGSDQYAADHVADSKPFVPIRGSDVRLERRRIVHSDELGSVFSESEDGSRLYVPYRMAARSIGVDPIDPPNEVCAEQLESEREKLRLRAQHSNEAAARSVDLQQQAAEYEWQAATL